MFRVLRERYRASYGCDCEGSLEGQGRVDPLLTDAYMDAVDSFTGVRANGCPWRAFDRPFTKRVIAAYEWHREGQLLAGVPHPSAKLIRGLAFYHRALQRSMAKQREIDRDNERRQHGR